MFLCKAWQRGLQQGIKGAQASQEKGSGQLDGAPGLAQTAQGRLVMEQLQGLGVFADGGGNLNSGQLQGLVTMLSKQGESGDVSHLITFFFPFLLAFFAWYTGLTAGMNLRGSMPLQAIVVLYMLQGNST